MHSPYRFERRAFSAGAGRIFRRAVCGGLLALTVRPRRSIEAENLVLRRQLALFKERGVKPRRIDAATRMSLAWLSRWCDWRSCLIVVRPETVVRWHRAGWRLFWRYKSRPGRPPIPLEMRQLIRRMARENPLWGEERIANELLVKLGVGVSPRTIRKYMPKMRPARPRGDQRWSTFLGNHATAIIACDFFVAVTATRRRYPWSALAITYVLAVAPPMRLQLLPSESHRFHW